jgi:hypothetical protein
MSFLIAILISVHGFFPLQTPGVLATPVSLSVEAGVLLRNGDLKRVARTPLMLLNEDFGAALLRAYPKGKRSVYLQGQVYLATKKFQEVGGKVGKEQAAAVLQINEFIKAHTVATAITDFDGKATIPAPPGDYFLFGVFEIGDEAAIWNVPVQLQDGNKSVVLDQNNTVK